MPDLTHRMRHGAFGPGAGGRGKLAGERQTRAGPAQVLS